MRILIYIKVYSVSFHGKKKISIGLIKFANSYEKQPVSFLNKKYRRKSDFLFLNVSNKIEYE